MGGDMSEGHAGAAHFPDAGTPIGGGSHDQPGAVGTPVTGSSGSMRPVPGMQETMSALSGLRIAVGLHHLVAPGLGSKELLGKRLDPRARLVVRVLGARYLAQALVAGRAPNGAVLALGAEVDAAHAGSMVVLALLDRGRRREGLTSALVAGGFALAGALAARDRPFASDGAPGGRVGFARWRDDVADRVARRLVPGYRGDDQRLETAT